MQRYYSFQHLNSRSLLYRVSFNLTHNRSETSGPFALNRECSQIKSHQLVNYFGSSSSLLYKITYGIQLTKGKRRGFQWDNSEQVLQNIQFQRNIVELVKEHGRQVEKDFEKMIEFVQTEQDAEAESFKPYAEIIEYLSMRLSDISWEQTAKSLIKSINDRSHSTNFDDLLKLQNSVFNVTHSNEYLSKGEHKDYDQYPLSKLIEIALNFLEKHENPNFHPQKYSNSTNSAQKLYGSEGCFAHWCSLEMYFKLRMHNLTVKDYIRLVYICLQSYPFYQFDEQFISSILNGIFKEIFLMTELELMQLFYVVSDRLRVMQFEVKHFKKFYSYEREILGNHDPKVKNKTYQNYDNSAKMFEHKHLVKIQDKILSRVVQKYSKKYLENKAASTSSSFKENDLLKLCFWIKQCLLFKNSSKTNYKQNVKQIIELLRVLVKRHYSTISEGQNQQSNSPSGQKRLTTTCKYVRYSQESPEMLLSISQVFSLTKEFLNSQEAQFQDQIDLSELLLAKEGLQNVQKRIFSENKDAYVAMIREIYAEKDTEKLKAVHLSRILSVAKIVRQILQSQSQQYMEDRQSLLTFFYTTIDTMSRFQQNQDTTELQVCLVGQIAQQMLQIGHFLWNNRSFKELHKNLTHIFNFNQVYSVIVKGIEQTINTLKAQQNSLPGQSPLLGISPSVVSKMLKIQIYKYFKHFWSKTKEQFDEKVAHFYEDQQKSMNSSKDNYQEIVDEAVLEDLIEHVFKSKDIILSFCESLLSLENQVNLEENTVFDDDEVPRRVFYIRELQWPMFNYLKILQLSLLQYLKLCKSIISSTYEDTELEDEDLISKLNEHNGFQKYIPYTKRIDAILKLLHRRNLQANKFVKHQLQQNSQSLNNTKILLPVGNNMYDHSSQQVFSKQGKALGEEILFYLKKEEFQVQRDQILTTFKKFFSQIKAFEMQYCEPIGYFNVLGQFVYKSSSQKTGSQQSHVLKFLSEQEMILKETQVEKLMLQINGFKCDLVSKEGFLKMQIGERIDLLRHILVKSGSSSSHNQITGGKGESIQKVHSL